MLTRCSSCSRAIRLPRSGSAHDGVSASIQTLDMGMVLGANSSVSRFRDRLSVSTAIHLMVLLAVGGRGAHSLSKRAKVRTPHPPMPAMVIPDLFVDSEVEPHPVLDMASDAAPADHFRKSRRFIDNPKPMCRGIVGRGWNEMRYGEADVSSIGQTSWGVALDQRCWGAKVRHADHLEPKADVLQYLRRRQDPHRFRSGFWH